ncbi:MAG: sugar ABC transporter permease [Candidatus Limiplasma sp.]|nr:sugar ABC transporter permease [Candidatus Limiplasma sp.]MEA5145016.1 sugar ABC transporter permease [Candidatus Limiplasma sp.]
MNATVQHAAKPPRKPTNETTLRHFGYNQKLAPYVFVAPFIFTFLLFFLYPMISTVIMSFQNILPNQVEFIGLRNYINLNDPIFFKALSLNLRYTFFTLLILIPMPMLLAVLLDSKLMRARNFYRSTLFIPALTSVVVAGTIFRLIFGEMPGSLMNQLVVLFGAKPIKWLKLADTSFIALIMLATWRWTGVNILYFLAGLQNIPRELYESAEIDGANAWQRFTRIVFPMLKPVTIYVLTISIYGGMAMFTESYMIFSGNRSPNNIGITIVGYLYRKAFEENNMGYGSAIGLALLLIVMIVNVIQLYLNGTIRREKKV